jgi:hypothetical protein
MQFREMTRASACQLWETTDHDEDWKQAVGGSPRGFVEVRSMMRVVGFRGEMSRLLEMRRYSRGWVVGWTG